MLSIKGLFYLLDWIDLIIQETRWGGGARQRKMSNKGPEEMTGARRTKLYKLALNHRGHLGEMLFKNQ